MPTFSIVITGCSQKEFADFATRSDMPQIALSCMPKDHDLVCRLPAELLERVYIRMEEEARKGWRDPDSEDALHFDGAFFPRSVEAIQPVRHLRGRVAARLARKKDTLPAVYSSPGFVFGTAETEKVKDSE